MAIAFYIPDQAKLMRKAKEQEQQILRMRETQLKLMTLIILNALRKFVDSAPTHNYILEHRAAREKACKKSDN